MRLWADDCLFNLTDNRDKTIEKEKMCFNCTPEHISYEMKLNVLNVKFCDHFQKTFIKSTVYSMITIELIYLLAELWYDV